MIERVSFTNFKSLRRADVALGRFMVIVGPNGSGKTSILDGLHYLAQVTEKPLASIMGGVFTPPNLKSRDSEGPMTLALSGRFNDVAVAVEAEINCKHYMGGRATWTATVTRRWGDAEVRTAELAAEVKVLSTPGAKPSRSPPKPGSLKPSVQHPQRRGSPFEKEAMRDSQSAEMTALARELGSAHKLRLDAGMLAAPSYSQEEKPRLAMDGKGLASVLADLAGRAPEALQSIQEAARKVIPSLERIRTHRAQVQEQEQQEIRIDDKPIAHTVDRTYWGHQLVLDFKGAPDVPAPLASEGTLLVIGLLTALLTEPRPRLLLLDDIDKALHPRAQSELVAQLRKVLEMDPALQIIATSHSPYLLDHFEAEGVLVTAVRPDGSTACAPLTDHPDFNRWKSTTRPGEMWSFLGEDWIVQQANAEPTPQ